MPARIVLDEEGRRAAIATVRAAADAVETPSRQLRKLIETSPRCRRTIPSSRRGSRPSFPASIPAGSGHITEYLPRDAIWVLDDPLELERQWGNLWSALEEAFSAARQKGELALPPDQHYLHERDVRPVLEQAPVLELSGLTLGGAEAAMGTAEVDFDLQPTAELRGGNTEPTTARTARSRPWCDRLEAWRELGTRR